MENEQKGYVYILTNPAFRENWVKIGKSSRPVDIRSKELDNTAVPLPFDIYATMCTIKYAEAEKLVHRYIERFTNLRIRNNREFFNVKPEEALEIFRDVALLLDDAVIEEVHKNNMLGLSASSEKKEPKRKEGEQRIWLIPYNTKYFDLHGCIEKFPDIYWNQYSNFAVGETGYLYGSAPDSAIRYRFEIVATDLPYSNEMEREREFYANSADFDEVIKHNRFVQIRITGASESSRLALPNLLDNGLKMAPRGSMFLTGELLEYIKANF
jgi:hypothetical protein